MLNYSLLGDIGPLVPKISKNAVIDLQVSFYSNCLLMDDNKEWYIYFIDNNNFQHQNIVGFTSDNNVKWALKVISDEATSVNNRFLSILKCPSSNRIILCGSKRNTSANNNALGVLILNTDGQVLQNRVYTYNSTITLSGKSSIIFENGKEYLYSPIAVAYNGSSCQGYSKIDITDFSTATVNLWQRPEVANLTYLEVLSNSNILLSNNLSYLLQVTGTSNSITMKKICESNSYLYISNKYNNRYYITVTNTNQLLCVSADDLSIIWNKKFSNVIYFPVVDNDLVYVNCNYKFLLVLDLDGNLVSVIQFRDPNIGFFGIKENKAVVMLNNNKIISFDISKVTSNRRNRVFKLVDISAFQPVDLDTKYYSFTTSSFAGTGNLTYSSSQLYNVEDAGLIIEKIR